MHQHQDSQAVDGSLIDAGLQVELPVLPRLVVQAESESADCQNHDQQSLVESCGDEGDSEDQESDPEGEEG